MMIYWSRSFPRVWTIRKWLLEADEEVLITDANPGPEQLLGCLKDQGEELTEVNLIEEEREVQTIFITASLSTVLRELLLDLLK